MDNLKLSKYQDEAVPDYWIVDPEEPSIVAYRYRGRRYVRIAEAVGDQPLELDSPFPVTIIPADLVR